MPPLFCVYMPHSHSKAWHKRGRLALAAKDVQNTSLIATRSGSQGYSPPPRRLDKCRHNDKAVRHALNLRRTVEKRTSLSAA